jgi:hypothetical protein
MRKATCPRSRNQDRLAVRNCSYGYEGLLPVITAPRVLRGQSWTKAGSVLGAIKAAWPLEHLLRCAPLVEGCMTLRLVSSGDGSAPTIRDHLLPLIRKHGTLDVQHDAVRVIALWTDEGMLEHWSPFSDLSPGRPPLLGIATPFSGSMPRPTRPAASMSGGLERSC